jgi:hypothetical protein
MRIHINNILQRCRKPLPLSHSSILFYNDLRAREQIRSFHPKRAFPNYTVASDLCFLNMKPISPDFKVVSKDAIAVSNRGKLLLELSPANGTGGYIWDDKISFALSTEEIGLCLSQLPHYAVSFSRNIGSYTNENIEKVLTLTPGDGATITFSIDHEKDGVAGYMAQGLETSALSIVIQAGEWEVLSTLMRDTLPSLCGWNKMMEIQTNNAIQNATNSPKTLF